MNLLGAKSIKFWAITLILIICLTTMTLFGFLTFINVSNSLNKQYDNESESVLKQVMFSFEYQFSNVENILQQLSQSVITKSTDGEVTSLLHNYQKILPTSGALIYGLENSKYFQGIGEKFPEGYNPVEQQWYQKAIKNKGEVVWTEPYLDNQTKEFIISASQAVTNSDGTQGVISIVFNLNEISKLISNSKIGKDGLVLLLSNNGTIIANQDTKLIGKSLFGNEHKKLLKATNKDQVPFVIDNKEYLLHSSTIQQNGMSVVTAISKDEINETLFASIMPILVAGILCFLLFGVISYLAALRGVKPLKKLGTLMGYVENGNYDVYARERDYKEVVRLAKGFNNMIYAIKKRDRDLIFTNEELKRAEEKLRGKYEELQESQRILKESEEKVARLASYDSLTGILNRRSLIKVLKNSLNQSLKAVIFIDLDNFKTVNDSLGHIFGDKLIIEVANKLSSLFVENKDVARISGDEFVLVIHDLEFEEQAELIAKEVVQLFNEPFKIDSKFLNVTASVGVALYPLHAVTSEDLLKIADMAMYRAKDMGKNGYRIFDEGIKQEVEEKVQIERVYVNALIIMNLNYFFNHYLIQLNEELPALKLY